MEKCYKIGEVEKILGIPRSTIRYYINKGLLQIEKNPKNGYRCYREEDLLDIVHLIVGRNALNMSMAYSEERVHAKEVADFHLIFQRQKEVLTQRLAKDTRSLAVIGIYERMLQRLEENLNRFSIIEDGSFWLFPRKYIYNVTTSIFHVGFTTSFFRQAEDTCINQGIYALVREEDFSLLTTADQQYRIREVPKSPYLYTVIQSSQNITSPTLLKEILKYSQSLPYETTGEIFICHLFQTENSHDDKCYYAEIFMGLQKK